jgi:hypothetical protein
LKIVSNVETKKVKNVEKTEKKIVLKERESPLKNKDIIIIDSEDDVNTNGKVELKPETPIKTILKPMNSKISFVEKKSEKVLYIYIYIYITFL